jgi:hypothetical protein
MRKHEDTHRIQFYILITVIIFTAKIFPQDSPIEFNTINILHQRFEHGKEFRQHEINQYLEKEHSFTDSLMQLRLSLNKKWVLKTLKNVIVPLSNIYVVDTATVFSLTDTSRRVNTFNKNGKKIVELYQQWANNQWVNYRRYSYTFDIIGNQLSSLYELWIDNQWIYDYRNTSTYDNNGNQLSYVSEVWTDHWSYISRISYTYNTNGKQLSFLSEYWLDNQWVNNNRYTTTYNTIGMPIMDLSEQWTNNQ